MSRRTRLKFKPKPKFTLSHHSSYATSTSHFPRSFSLLGRDIQFPNKLLPLYTNNKICFVGDSTKQFFDAIQQKQVNIKTLEEVSISIAGQRYQNASSIMNLILFAFSMCCFCWRYLFKLNKFRKKYYPKYRFKDYQGLAKIIQTFSDVDTLVINIQDNDISLEKIQVIQDAVSRSNTKHFVFRNMAYFIVVDKVQDFFRKLRNKNELNFAFVWEHFVMESQKEKSVQQQVGLISLKDDIS